METFVLFIVAVSVCLPAFAVLAIVRPDHFVWRMWQRLRGRKLLFYTDYSGISLPEVESYRMTWAVDNSPYECWG
jgi:hypothetical protein